VELDFVLVSSEIEITDFRVPDVRYSDHRPLICDFNIHTGALRRDSAA
jgi:endonuclease/exonuclease/phosphatase (EEP) superfamily protein YafD